MTPEKPVLDPRQIHQMIVKRKKEEKNREIGSYQSLRSSDGQIPISQKPI